MTEDRMFVTNRTRQYCRFCANWSSVEHHRTFNENCMLLEDQWTCLSCNSLLFHWKWDPTFYPPTPPKRKVEQLRLF